MHEENANPLSAYRDSLQSDITDKEKEYHTTITYISAGALAFFLTVNEKFFQIETAHVRWLLFVSLCCLLLSVLLYVAANMVDVTADKKLMDKVDSMIVNPKLKDDLLQTWKIWLKRSQYIYYGRLILMVLGILFEGFFVMQNLNQAKPAAAAPQPVIQLNPAHTGDTIRVLILPSAKK